MYTCMPLHFNSLYNCAEMIWAFIDWLIEFNCCMSSRERQNVSFEQRQMKNSLCCNVSKIHGIKSYFILFKQLLFFWYISAIRINFIATCMYHASTTKWIHVSVVKSGMKIYLSISTINILIMIKNSKN